MRVNLGHMQITYQLWMGGISKPSPFWFQRLPSGKWFGAMQLRVQCHELLRSPTMPSEKPSEDVLLKTLEIQWQDHFQTRAQTWKALEITAVLTVALVGLDWQVGNPLVTVGAGALLFVVALFGTLITLKHRTVEITKFRIITSLEEELGVADPNLKLPEPIKWWHIFRLRKSSTPLFILRMHFIIQLFAVAYVIIRLLR